MPRRILAPLLATAVVSALVAGCTSTVTGTPTAGGSSSTSQEPVAWIDAVCGAVVRSTDAAAEVPNIAAGDLPATQRAMSTYLGGVVSALDRGASDLDAVGPSPIEGGDQLVTKVRTTTNKLKTDLAAEKARLDAVDSNDPSALALAFVGIVTTLQEVSQSDPLADLNTNEKLRTAASQAENCRRLNDVTSVPTLPVPLPTPTR